MSDSIYTCAPDRIMDEEPVVGKPRSVVFNGANVTVTQPTPIKEMTDRFRSDSDENYKGVPEDKVYGMSKGDFEKLPSWDQNFIKNNFKG